MDKKLTKGQNRLIAGVCSGGAEYLKMDPTLIRLAFAATSLLTCIIPGIILYVVFIFIMPDPANAQANQAPIQPEAKAEVKPELKAEPEPIAEAEPKAEA